MPVPHPFLSLSNPRYLEDGRILLDVTFAGDSEICEFVADPTDCTPYGPDIFNRAVNGEWGEPAPYTPPVQEPQEG